MRELLSLRVVGTLKRTSEVQRPMPFAECSPGLERGVPARIYRPKAFTLGVRGQGYRSLSSPAGVRLCFSLSWPPETGSCIRPVLGTSVKSHVSNEFRPRESPWRESEEPWLRNAAENKKLAAPLKKIN